METKKTRNKRSSGIQTKILGMRLTESEIQALYVMAEEKGYTTPARMLSAQIRDWQNARSSTQAQRTAQAIAEAVTVPNDATETI